MNFVTHFLSTRTFVVKSSLRTFRKEFSFQFYGWGMITFLMASTGHILATESNVSSPAVMLTNVVTITNIVVVTNSIGTATGKSAVDLDWFPPQDEFDWIQLKSGEWLKGRIKAMQNREIEFDSEEVDDQTFDWVDIRRLRSPRTMDVLFLDGERASGPVTVTPDQITVHGAESLVMHRGAVLGLTPGGSKERNYWSGMASLGLTLRAGNTEQVEYNAQVHLQRRTPATRLSFDYIGNLSSITSGQGTNKSRMQTANNHRVNSEFDVWLSRRFYLIVPFAEYYKDPFQNLEYRLTGGAGVGYDLIDRSKLEWNVTTGPAYQYTKYESSLPGEPTEKDTVALVFGSRFDWDITSRIELILEYRGQFTSVEAGETTHHAVGTLSLDLTKRFDLDVSLVWDRVSDPKVGADGVQPEPDDFRLIVGLSVDF